MAVQSLDEAPVRASPLARLRTFVLGPAAPGRVPERVERVIEREQETSEILVSVIQLFAVAGFALLYTLAPKAFPPDVPFEPVPVTLAVYLVFTLFRFGLACRRRLPRWFLALSVVVDVTVLMVTIWSFHLQYQAPPALYLKAPTMMYAFILIALRTLRFEPGFVLLAGMTSAVGWLILVGYALYADPEMMITRSYTTYMMSYSILIGAEVDKVVSLLMVTLVLALALYRARTLLLRATSEQMAAAELARFFAPEVAGRIRAAEIAIEPGQAEQREAAILMADLRGFTPLTHQLAPVEVMTLLSEYQARVVRAVRANGGSIDKFLGDGILASFGATRPSATPAADALRAIDAILDAAADWADERRGSGLPAPAVGVAVSTGRVMFGAIGDQDRLEYTVIGDPVNRVAKLEKHTKVERVRAVCDAAAYEDAIGQGYATDPRRERRPGRRVEGVAAPVDLVVLG